MRSQTNSGLTTLKALTTAEPRVTEKRIPRHEQDEDLWRHAIPGRDPVTQMRGPGVEDLDPRLKFVCSVVKNGKPCGLPLMRAEHLEVHMRVAHGQKGSLAHVDFSDLYA